MAELLICARCGGEFPGPGVQQEEALYCCTVCAAGELPVRRGMKWFGMATAAAAAGALTAWWLRRNP